MKLHWCCGDVYLKGYVNIDIKGLLTSDLTINDNITTLENYYKRPFSTDFSKRERSSFIVDKVASILSMWPFDANSIDQIVMISCIEHFSLQDAKHIISEISRVLKKGGSLIIDFPDIKKDVELFYDDNPNFLSELIYCNGKDQFSCHKHCYTPKSFAQLWGMGFTVLEKVYVKHDYPMIGMEVIKNND